jgi:hypothetical protein
MKLLLDGSKMKEKVFYEKFSSIVGVSFDAWIKRDDVKSGAGSEWYDYQDDAYLVGGTMYAPPKFFKKDTPQDIKEAV